MSTNEFDRPPSRARRLVLRKIAATEAGASPPSEIMPRTASPAEASARGSALDAAAAAARLSAPAPTPGSRRPPSPSIPFFDATPGGGTPVPNRARASLPPVVANLLDPQSPARPKARAASTRKAGLLGAAAGLVLVGVVVAGARLAHRLTPPAPMAMAPPAVSASPAATSATSASATAPAIALLPQPAWTAIAKSEPAPPPVERPQPRHLVAPVRTAAPAPAASAAAKVTAEPPALEGAARTAAPAGSAPAATAQPAPDDSAPSLVPVIPPGPPPEPDPLVKAILEDDHK